MRAQKIFFFKFKQFLCAHYTRIPIEVIVMKMISSDHGVEVGIFQHVEVGNVYTVNV